MTTTNDWAKALTSFVDEIGGDGPSLWQWAGITPTPEKVVDYLRDQVHYLIALYAHPKPSATRPLTVDDLADIMRGDTLNPITAGFTIEDLARHLLTHPATAPLLNPALHTHSGTPALEETDRLAVDQFAAAMKLKLSRKSKEGKLGWKEASAEHLSRLLCEHIRKGDPVDVANFAMMLHQNGQSITPDCTPLVDVDALIHTLNTTAEYMEPGSEDRWGVENVAFQLSEQPNRRPPSP
jgi:hypothetical protein